MTGQQTLHPLNLIRRKRDGHELTPAEIQHLITAIVAREISDAQTAAFLMATFLRGLSSTELAALTLAMRDSGEVLDRRSLPTTAILIDKHSTGGVGDKTSLLIAPILAAAGLRSPAPIYLPMISGRALGHTGGTLDKLETIPGFRTELSLTEMREVLAETHAALVGQTPTLVPADRILYALRDHTATIESPDLICASIMSKKLAASLDALVLDVKTGSGAFLRSPAEARHLAHLMVETGNRAGTETIALLTSMDQPLGRFAGNWLEVQECVEILRAGPNTDPDHASQHPLSADLITLSLTLAGHMLTLAGAAPTPVAGIALAQDLLQSGAAFQSWLHIVEAQGGDTSVFANPEIHHHPAATRTLHAPHSGYLAHMDTTAIGWAVHRLGAGRLTPEAPVDPHAGIKLHAKLGNYLHPNQPLVTLFATHPDFLGPAETLLRDSLHLADAPPTLIPLIHEVIATPASLQFPRPISLAR